MEGDMFRFEGLDVWRRASVIAREMMDVADDLDHIRKYKIAEQLRRAALSISNNIAEGSGSSSRRDFRVFLNSSHRSVFETANILTLCRRSKWLSEAAAMNYLRELEEIARMIIGFSRSLCALSSCTWLYALALCSWLSALFQVNNVG